MDDVSERQNQMLSLLVEGLSMQEIAEQLEIPLKTVEITLSRLARNPPVVNSRISTISVDEALEGL